MIKKMIVLVLFVLSVSFCFSYSYPATIRELLVQFCNEKQQVGLVTNQTSIHGYQSTHEGIIIIVQEDYLVLKEDFNNVILFINNIVEVYTP